GEPFPTRGPLTTITVRNNNDYLLGIHRKSKDDISVSTFSKKVNYMVGNFM
ncbi:unnamed protein product, partial [Arabidopsis lyrata]